MASTYVFTANGQTFKDIGGGVGNDLTSVTAQSTTWGTLTVVVEGSLDGTNYITLMGQDLNLGTSSAAGFTATGKLFRFDVAGLTFVQLRCSAFTSTGTLLIDYGKTGVRA